MTLMMEPPARAPVKQDKSEPVSRENLKKVIDTEIRIVEGDIGRLQYRIAYGRGRIGQLGVEIAKRLVELDNMVKWMDREKTK